MIEGLRRWAVERGYRIGWGPFEVVTTALEEIETRHASGVLDEGLYRSELGSLDGRERPRERGLVTVVVVVKPRPAHTVSFDLEGERAQAILPPTYVNYQPLFEEVGRDLQAHGLPGAQVERVAAPLKLVATRLGLVRYGLNNVTYALGAGSYFQLLGYVTDAALPLPDGWRPCAAALLPECETCGMCLSACPTGAIDEGRVLLRAERCLTFANENPGPWPPWIPRRAHHCLLGCLLCQRCCPVNPQLPLESTGVAFTREESRALLADDGSRSSPPWDGIRAKLGQLGQPYAEPVLSRNLRALVEARLTRA